MNFQDTNVCCGFGDVLLLKSGTECFKHPLDNVDCRTLLNSHMIGFIFTSIVFSLLFIIENLMLLISVIATGNSVVTTTYRTNPITQKFLSR